MSYPNAHRLQTAQSHRCLVRRDADAEIANDDLDFLPEVQIGYRDGAQQQVRMAPDILGQRLDREIRAWRLAAPFRTISSACSADIGALNT